MEGKLTPKEHKAYVQKFNQWKVNLRHASQRRLQAQKSLKNLTYRGSPVVNTEVEPSIEVLTSKTFYTLKLQGCSISVCKENDKLTIETNTNRNEFTFVNSEPNAVKIIGELLVKASEL